jgi:hypothetical protein
MTFVRVSIATCFLVACASASAAVPLDGFIHFDDPYLCAPSKDLNALLEGLIRWQPAGDTYKGELASPPVPAGFRNQIGTAQLVVTGDEYRATLPLRGTWHGLPLRSLVLTHWVESEGGFYLVFDASREQVLDVANKAGFRIPPSGSEYRDGDVMGINVGVDTYDGLGALYCIAG